MASSLRSKSCAPAAEVSFADDANPMRFRCAAKIPELVIPAQAGIFNSGAGHAALISGLNFSLVILAKAGDPVTWLLWRTRHWIACRQASKGGIPACAGMTSCSRKGCAKRRERPNRAGAPSKCKAREVGVDTSPCAGERRMHARPSRSSTMGIWCDFDSLDIRGCFAPASGAQRIPFVRRKECA
jgi:hypothetical protein